MVPERGYGSTMSVCGLYHKQLNEQGVGMCSVPMWNGGLPDGFCDKPAYGFPTPSKLFRNGFTGRMQREDGRYDGYVPFLACEAHGGPPLHPTGMETK